MKKDQPAAAPSLLARIDELHREIEDFVERKIDEIAAAEGPRRAARFFAPFTHERHAVQVRRVSRNKRRLIQCRHFLNMGRAARSRRRRWITRLRRRP